MDELLSKLVDVIRDAAGRTTEGEPVRLPPERDIAQTLGVQRSTLREALATLTHLGILNRTQGRGTYVSLLRSDFVQLYFNVALAVGHITIDDLETLREMLEREIVRRAVSTATARDVFDLEERALKMESAKTTKERLDAEYEFHGLLATMTHSPVIELLMDGLSSVLRQALRRRRYAVRSLPGSAERMDAIHLPIAKAIGRRDEDAAVAAMDEHFALWSTLCAELAANNRTQDGRMKRTTRKPSTT
ncbi:MAG: FCD domain-containing protein [Candidatus Velthaea sp.]